MRERSDSASISPPLIRIDGVRRTFGPGGGAGHAEPLVALVLELLA